MNDINVFELTKNEVLDVLEIEKNIFGSGDFEKISNTITDANHHYNILKINESVAGFIEYVILLPEAEIYNIAIKNEFRGNGYSKILMSYFIEKCKNSHCETIYLEVNNINHVAINLYENYGFKEYSIRKNYYGDNDAILMKKVL